MVHHTETFLRKEILAFPLGMFRFTFLKKKFLWIDGNDEIINFNCYKMVIYEIFLRKMFVG